MPAWLRPCINSFAEAGWVMVQSAEFRGDTLVTYHRVKVGYRERTVALTPCLKQITDDWEAERRDQVVAASHGLRSLAEVDENSRTLRVTTVRPFAMAVAAIRPSMTGKLRPAESRPH